jgi:hypothetical protein
MTAAETIVPAISAGGCRDRIEQVVDSGNVVGKDLEQRRDAQHEERRSGREPGEAAAEGEVTAVGRDAHHQHRQENPETDCGREPDAECDREHEIEG